MVTWLAACAAPEDPARWPVAADDAAALRLAAAHGYVDALAASAGDPPDAAVVALGAAGTTPEEPAARALLSAWILDAEVRRATDGRQDLLDVVRAAPDPLGVDGWRAAARAVGGDGVDAWVTQDSGAGRLDYGAALHWFGVAWVDADDGRRTLVADPAASPQARARRARWAPLR